MQFGKIDTSPHPKSLQLAQNSSEEVCAPSRHFSRVHVLSNCVPGLLGSPIVQKAQLHISLVSQAVLFRLE